MAIETKRQISATNDPNIHEGRKKEFIRAHSWLLFLFLLIAPQVMAQSPTPSPAPANNGDLLNADALTNLVIVAGRLIPRIQETIEARSWVVPRTWPFGSR